MIQRSKGKARGVKAVEKMENHMGQSKIVLVVIAMVLSGGLAAAPHEEIQTDDVAAKSASLLQMEAAQQKAEIERLSIEEARALRDYLRGKAIQADRSAGATFYLYEHLATIAAIDLAEKRLHKLFLVFAIVLVLFSSFLGYLLVAQNRLIRRLAQGQRAERQAGSPSVYRGD